MCRKRSMITMAALILLRRPSPHPCLPREVSDVILQGMTWGPTLLVLHCRTSGGIPVMVVMPGRMKPAVPD